MKGLMIISFMLLAVAMQGQPVVKVEVSADTIAPGQTVKVSYTIENGQGDFQIPEVSGLPLVSGPNTSSNFVYQNGKMSSSQSYSFLFRPVEEGLMVIPGTTYVTGQEVMDIQPVEIVVLASSSATGMPKSIHPSSPSKPSREKRKF